ncbi:MAG: hypothetical protein MAG451_00948 [Anaerolineales bacterium]|nr:hypothetical protein [Anaerolineales bacterium]
MTEFYRAKFNELFMEFTRYLVEYPEFAEHIPEGAQIVLLDRQDPHYNQQAIGFAQRARETDDVPERSVVLSCTSKLGRWLLFGLACGSWIS